MVAGGFWEKYPHCLPGSGRETMKPKSGLQSANNNQAQPIIC